MLGYIPYLISISNYRTNPTFHPIDQTDNICMSIHAADRNASLYRPLCTASVPSHGAARSCSVAAGAASSCALPSAAPVSLQPRRKAPWQRQGPKNKMPCGATENETPYDVGCFVSVISGSYLSLFVQHQTVTHIKSSKTGIFQPIVYYSVDIISCQKVAGMCYRMECIKYEYSIAPLKRWCNCKK